MIFPPVFLFFHHDYDHIHHVCSGISDDNMSPYLLKKMVGIKILEKRMWDYIFKSNKVKLENLLSVAIIPRKVDRGGAAV